MNVVMVIDLCTDKKWSWAKYEMQHNNTKEYMERIVYYSCIKRWMPACKLARKLQCHIPIFNTSVLIVHFIDCLCAIRAHPLNILVRLLNIQPFTFLMKPFQAMITFNHWFLVIVWCPACTVDSFCNWRAHSSSKSYSSLFDDGKGSKLFLLKWLH